jgi:AcrR family transcriptional regulator
MRSDTIKDAALTYFAQYGYEGTSLAQIADAVGIKKQSIYSHFEGKDAIFLAVLEDTYSIELEREQSYLEQHFDQPLADCLYGLICSYLQRYESDHRLKFWLRTSFFPPVHLYSEVLTYAYRYIDQIDALYLPRFQRAVEQKEITQPNAEIANKAFSALIDSICVELVYGGTQRTEQKLQAAWTVYWDGITK